MRPRTLSWPAAPRPDDHANLRAVGVSTASRPVVPHRRPLTRRGGGLSMRQRGRPPPSQRPPSTRRVRVALGWASGLGGVSTDRQPLAKTHGGGGGAGSSGRLIAEPIPRRKFMLLCIQRLRIGWHRIRMPRPSAGSAQSLPPLFLPVHGQKCFPPGFRELELSCIVSLLCRSGGFAAVAKRNGTINTSISVFTATQTIRLKFRREDHNNDWPESITWLCAARSDFAFLRATPHRRSQPDV